MREIEAAAERLQPMLVGTTSIEKSEQLGEFLERHGYKRIDFSDPAALKPLYEAARAGRASQVLRHSQRAFPRAGGVHRRRGRRARRDHHRHQHGRPRHRHPARRQRRDAAAPGGRSRRLRGRARARKEAEIRAEVADLKEKAHRRPAASTSSAPSATRAAASTTSCAAARAGRAIPGARNSSCRCRTI